jgi:hypothetical protein
VQKIDYKGPSLISGYGIQYEHQERGYMACNVFNKMIENKQDQQDQEGTKSFYKDVETSWADWEVVKSLKDTLCVSFFGSNI